MGIGEVGELLRRSTVHIRGTNSRQQSAGSGVIWDALNRDHRHQCARGSGGITAREPIWLNYGMGDPFPRKSSREMIA